LCSPDGQNQPPRWVEWAGFDSRHFLADKASRLYFQHCEELEKALANSSFLLKWPMTVGAQCDPKRRTHQIDRKQAGLASDRSAGKWQEPSTK
jgi:hypothetical protein